MIIGIGGVSRSGKTFLARQLAERLTLEGKKAEVLSQDNFLKPKASSSQVQGQLDWERPSFVKWEVLLSALEKSAADVVIVEGQFAFYPADLRSMYDRKIFLEISKQTFYSRKDTDTRWADEPEWYSEHILRSYMKYGQKRGEDSDYLTLDSNHPIDMDKLLIALTLK